MASKFRTLFLGPLVSLAYFGALGLATPVQAADKPNILVIWGDDIGQSNISAYTMGLVGYHTPNIDRLAREGMIFTDYYGEQSCTAGRSSYIMGQSVLRTGLSKVGLPGAKQGTQVEDPTIAGLLKAHGYATGQFGKNHLGDQDSHLPSNHGFDEFFGNLYHLNAKEEPENEDYPKDPKFRERFGPRGVIKSAADGTIEDTGPLTKKRMETIDEETVKAPTPRPSKRSRSIRKTHCWSRCWRNSTRFPSEIRCRCASVFRIFRENENDHTAAHSTHRGGTCRLHRQGALFRFDDRVQHPAHRRSLSHFRR